MTENFIEYQIITNLNALYNLNDMMYDYWLCELYDEYNMRINENWNEVTLEEMNTDVENCEKVYMQTL